MAKPKKNSKLEKWEVAVVKAMIKTGSYNDQEMQAFFTRPTRSINHRVISEIRKESKHKSVGRASPEELERFLAKWPNVDLATGLDLKADELLVKAREAMIAAVHTFNGAGLTFRSELFIVTSVIAWTYLMHAWYARAGVDYRHRNKKGEVLKTKEGADKYWELSQCLKHGKCPLSEGCVLNLEFLLGLRHEIEHRSTSRIDEAISAKLQACCLNFNSTIRNEFGAQYGLEKRLPIALQFVTFDTDQKGQLKAAQDLPANIETMLDTFHEHLTEEQIGDLEYAYRVIFVPKTANSAGKADQAIEFVKAGSDEAIEANKVFLKETDKRRFIASGIVKTMKEEGFLSFNISAHTQLWQKLNAKDPAKGYGNKGDYNNSWIWYESWLDRVREHCQENADRYQTLA